MNAMATLATPTIRVEHKVILHGVSWETYERLLAEHPDAPSPRFTYDQGELEIMVQSARHEEPNRTLATLVEIVAWGLRISFRRLGSTTFKREKLLKGFEPDSCFYFSTASLVRGRDIDAEVDPRPDLVIEVDITSLSVPRFPIFAAFGVPEVWRYDGSRVIFYRLENARYVEVERSAALLPLTAELATQFLEESRRMDSIEWFDHVLDWARQQR